ncbi:major facilitator superfamily transporter [Pseudomassariella vexata]|uniref:Major facilitator superfamily transporter n=1 Tax=Pseudomassariella vexata TaxID=1141098 RepID=A0A1Y2DHK7_9PEZI|nr:major facilitator superfamily transporter [Pseudomassariella vexata]ORY58731.1 major facilitator superfamily transporter [Pseudomassariella vexata]
MESPPQDHVDTTDRSSQSVEKLESHGDATEPAREVEEQRQNPPEWRIAKHELLIILSLCIINMVVALDASIIVTALNSITIEIGGTTTEAFWIGTSYLLSCTVAMPPLASLSEIFGRPICLIFSLSMFTLGSILCCVAHSIPLLLAGRSVQGIGGGGIWVLSLLLLTDIVPLRHRPKWWALISIGWAVGLVIGPLIGGGVVQHTTWRWVFYLNFPFCAFGLVVVPTLLTMRPRVETTRQKLGRVDWVGGLLFTASLTVFLFAISSGGIQYDWNSAPILVPLVLGVCGLVATGVWEEHGAMEPMLKRSLFHNWSSIIAYLGGFAQGLVMYGQLYYIAFFFVSVKQLSPIQAGVNLLPVMLVLIPSGAVGGAIVSRMNAYRPTIWVGWLLATLSSGLELLWDADVSKPVWAVTLVISGLGHGIILNTQSFACQAMAKPGDVAAAAAMYGFARQFGTSVGVSVGSTTFQNVMAMKLGREGLPRGIAYNAEGFVTELVKMPDGGATKETILDAYVFGFLGVWQVYLGISGVIFLLSFFMKHFDMNKAIESEHKLESNHISKLLDRRQRVSL